MRHRSLDMLRVAKIINKDHSTSTRIWNEANLIKNLKHPDIPVIYDILEDDTSICIIEEYISGKSLREYVEEKNFLKIKDICQIGISLCNILEYLHDFGDGILHMDLKPDNIIISDDNSIKIIDFDNSTSANNMEIVNKGSPLFAAPEQYSREHALVQSDIYSLGMILVFMASGGKLSSTDAIGFREIGISNYQLYPIIRKCIRHRASLRYRSVKLLREELEKIINKDDSTFIKHSYTFYVSGTRSGIGVTNLVLSMGHFFQRNGFSCLIKDNSGNDYLLYEAIKGRLDEEGSYYYKGVRILPNYCNCIEVNEEAQIIIFDGGVNRSDEPYDVNIVVAGGKYATASEIKTFKSLDENVAIFANLLSGKDFYKYATRLDDRKCYRIPCIYKWYEDNEIFSGTMMDFLSDYLPQLSRWISRADFYTKIRYLYGRLVRIYVRFFQKKK